MYIDKNGNIIYKYDKICLIPFWEYIPFRDLLFFIDEIVIGFGYYVPLDKFTTSVTSIGTFTTPIFYKMKLLKKSLFVIPKVFIRYSVPFKNKGFWIPSFKGMTAKVISLRLLQEAQIIFSYPLNLVEIR